MVNKGSSVTAAREVPGKLPPLLLRWYEKNARKLPWREHPSPYEVWVSEIMLQQTRVEAVIPYFTRFTEALPDIQALAACPEDQLLKLWEGLGYYNRVRNMQRAARIVEEKYDGKLPASYRELLTLPGIGSYTAGAIASIAYGESVPAADGNVLRVLSRITENDADMARQSVRRDMEKSLQKVIPKDCPGLFNQALMELGAMVCLPNTAPECERCPAAQLCQANRDGRQMEFPVKSEKKPRRIEARTVLVIRDSAHAILRRRPAGGLLAGLYELPNCEGHLTEEEAREHVARMGFSPIRIRTLPAAKHVFTHIEWHMIGYLAIVKDRDVLIPSGEEDAGELLFPETARIRQDYPVPSAFSAYMPKVFENLKSL